MPTPGSRTDPYQGFNFLVEIEGIEVGGFSECSGLVAETQFEEYREGGVNDFVHRLPGPSKNPPLVLKHGLTLGTDLWDWYLEVVDAVSLGTPVERKNGTIYLLDKDQSRVMWWYFTDALPMKWTGPELRAESGGVVFESVELTHRGLIRPTLKSVLRLLG
jgi:phage tail-like protein